MIFQRSVYTEIEISAPAEQVWAVLTDFAAYKDWNPFIISAKGALCVGEILEVVIQLHGQKAQPYKIRILEVDPPKRLRWLGHFKMKGLLDGDHVFEVVPTNDGSTHNALLIHRETFTGILAPFIWPFLGARFLKSFEHVNNGVKQRAEASIG